jgi:hypothetical protein
VQPSPLLLWPFIGLFYQPWMIDGDDCGEISGMKESQGKIEILAGNLSLCRSVQKV